MNHNAANDGKGVHATGSLPPTAPGLARDLARIGQLLWEALVLAEAGAGSGGSVPVTAVPVAAASRVAASRRDAREVAIIACLEQMDSVTPREIRRKVGGSRATITRVLAKMVAEGVIVMSGRTRRATYRLVHAEEKAA
jgi:hypothetical protein